MESATAFDRSQEQELAFRHRYGDAEAFAEVFTAFRDMVYNLCWRMVGDPEVAADVSQEVFLRVYRHLAGFRGRSSLKTWIYRIAINQCRSRLSRRLPPMVPLDGVDRGGRAPADPGRGPEARAAAREEQRLLARALARVPSPFREAVVLRDVEDLSYEEIAEVMGSRIGTVRSRIARGRQRLREILEHKQPPR